jgi:mannose-6-phosphate isomerase-like protein (cupin superfamily)
MKVIRRDEIPALDSGQGEIIRELAGLAQATAQRLSLAEVTITPNGGSREHYHRQMEEVYYLLQGQAQLTLGDEACVVGPGDSVVIPPGAGHKIVNVGTTDVVMIVACAPAWHEDDNVFLE